MINKLNTNSLKLNILKSLGLIFIIFFFLIISVVISSQNITYEKANEKFHIILHKSINHIMNHNKYSYVFLLERAISSNRVKELIIKNDRENLYKIFKPKFDMLQKENKYLEIWHFIKPDGRSLLRVHKKDKYGDRLDLVRPTISNIIKNHKTIIGYETGKYSTSYRIIIPIFKDKIYIGSLGIGINPNYFINEVKKEIDQKGVLFIKNENLKLFSKSSEFKIQNYILQSDIDKSSLKILKLLPKDYNFEDNFQLIHNSRDYKIHTLNILGYSGKTYGKYLFISDFSKIKRDRENSLFYLIIVLMIFIIIIFIVVRFYIDKFNIKIDKFYKQILTKQQDHEDKIKELKDRYEIAITGTNDGLWDWNLITNDIYFSPRWKHQLGYEDDELENSLETWLQHIHPDDKNNVINKYTQKIDNKTDNYENKHRLKHKDGSWVWIQNRGKIIFNKSGQAIRMVGFHTDITKEYKVKEKLREQEEMIIAQSRHAAMGEMISMIAHQWRQPLSVISMGANNVIADIELDILDNDTLKNNAMEILEQTQELSHTIDDFKNFFEPNRPKDKLLVSDIVKDTMNIIGKSLTNNDIVVINEFKTTKIIQTYSRELMQVFINIINNAKDVLKERKIKDKKIKISIEDKKTIVSIKISDNANGISNDIIKKVFDPYFTTKEEQNGTGLGLYMSKTIIEKHLNGTINVYNDANGAVFEIDLPIENKDD